jgi:hypothetical protein
MNTRRQSRNQISYPPAHSEEDGLENLAKNERFLWIAVPIDANRGWASGLFQPAKRFTKQCCTKACSKPFRFAFMSVHSRLNGAAETTTEAA